MLKVIKTNLELQHVKYAVLALGSKEYPDTYCSLATVDEWLKNNGAKAFFDIIEVDNANPADIQNWNQALVKATKLDLHAVNIEKVFDNWTLQQRDLLNPNSLGQPAYNIELTASHEAVWQAGDIAEIQPGNSPERINKFYSIITFLKMRW